ncbi:MAG: aminopeptidase [Candidatus Odinarchaeota archaeon]
MFDPRVFYRTENEKIMDRYESTILKINEIIAETGNHQLQDSEKKKVYYRFFHETGKYIIKLCEYEKLLNDDYFASTDFGKLLKENHALYSDIIPENYENSYANPVHAVKVFGDKFGQIFSLFYCFYVPSYIEYAFSHRIYKMEEYNKLFIDVFSNIKDRDVEYEKLVDLMTEVVSNENSRKRDFVNKFNIEYSKDYRFFTDIIEKTDFQDPRYLFKGGKYITDNEIRIAEFLLKYPNVKLKKLAKEIVNAYIRGFDESNKDVTKKATVGFYYKIGMEKLYREILKEFRSRNLETVILNAYSSEVNKQFDYDHKFDNAPYLTEKYAKMVINSYKHGMETNRAVLAEFSGPVYFAKFGEPPFSPKTKKENLKLDGEQQKLYQKFLNEINQIYYKYIPETETSFCIIAFPTPEIGEKFEEIFEATVEINMLESKKYEKIQQYMVEVLDKADSVHIKGKGGNESDLILKMQELEDPEKQTNFVNGGATVNIPVGEVFTAPQLEGTNGVLHAEETYQDFFRYDNLKLTFKDGYIMDYSCTNFESEEENRKYIEENLLFPHKTLPIGEFAIGTNTLAYVVARKYNIMNILPVLIIEKTGPHIAIGDTCFAHSEDLATYGQFDNKKIVAKENEKSAKRKTDMMEAYTNKHSDITLAFDSLGSITAVMKDGKGVDIIKDGRFVLEGTEELNVPLDEMHAKR